MEAPASLKNVPCAQLFQSPFGSPAMSASSSLYLFVFASVNGAFRIPEIISIAEQEGIEIFRQATLFVRLLKY